MNPAETDPAPRANPLVRWFVVGLPLGLLIMGALSFVIYFNKRHAKEAALKAPSQYAAMLRRDLNLDDYRRYIRIFENEIGPRTTEKPENIAAAKSFIESTLGFGNMGYQVLRREIGERDARSEYIEVELKGQDSSGVVHLVTARYDGTKSRDMAALICLAGAFTGTVHRQSIRFVAWYGGPDSDGKFVLDRYQRGLPGSAANTFTVLELSGPGSDDPDALDWLKSIASEIGTLADGGHKQ